MAERPQRNEHAAAVACRAQGQLRTWQVRADAVEPSRRRAHQHDAMTQGQAGVAVVADREKHLAAARRELLVDAGLDRRCVVSGAIA